MQRWRAPVSNMKSGRRGWCSWNRGRLSEALITVSGRITDGTGVPLPGVTVLHKSTGKGALTDEKGNYTVSVPGDAVLTFSLIGFTSQEIPVNNRTTLDVVLLTSTSNLDQVIVVGYGTQKKANLTWRSRHRKRSAGFPLNPGPLPMRRNYLRAPFGIKCEQKLRGSRLRGSH